MTDLGSTYCINDMRLICDLNEGMDRSSYFAGGGGGDFGGAFSGFRRDLGIACKSHDFALQTSLSLLRVRTNHHQIIEIDTVVDDFIYIQGVPKKVPSIEIRPFVLNVRCDTFGN